MENHDHRNGRHGGGVLNPDLVNTAEVHTVSAGTPADIDTACSNYDVVILQQGATYSGGTTITVPNETKVYAYSATIDYTGTGEAVVLAGSAGQNPRPRPMWFGGTISGNPDADAGITVRDTYGSITRGPEIEGFDGTGSGRGDGYVVKNVDAWSEENALYSPSLSNNHRAIAFRPASVTGGSGTGSFKGTEIEGGHIETAGTGGYGIYTAGTVYDSSISDVAANVNENDTLVSLGGGMGGSTVENIRGEAQGSSGVTTLQLRAFDGALPTVDNVACSGAATDLDDPNNNYQSLSFTSREGAYHVKSGSGDTLALVADPNNGFDGSGAVKFAYDENRKEMLFQDKSGTKNVTPAYEPAGENLSGTTGVYTGQPKMDDGTNTTHGDPDLCVWNGSAWRQVGTTNTFT